MVKKWSPTHVGLQFFFIAKSKACAPVPMVKIFSFGKKYPLFCGQDFQKWKKVRFAKNDDSRSRPSWSSTWLFLVELQLCHDGLVPNVLVLLLLQLQLKATSFKSKFILAAPHWSWTWTHCPWVESTLVHLVQPPSSPSLPCWSLQFGLDGLDWCPCWTTSCNSNDVQFRSRWSPTRLRLVGLQLDQNLNSS